MITKTKYIIFLHNHADFQHNFLSVLPISKCHHNSKSFVAHVATDGQRSIRRHIEIFSFLELLWAVSMVKVRWRQILTVSWMLRDFSLQFPEGVQRAGRSIVASTVVQQQDLLWQSPSSLRVDCRLQPSLKHVTIGCNCDSRSMFQVGPRICPWESQKMVNINLTADGCALNIFATGDGGCFHCMLFLLVSSWYYLIQVSSPATIRCRSFNLRDKKPSGGTKCLSACTYVHP
jgi:hypothetical protein